MTHMTRGRTTVESVFGIHGENENDMSAGFAYVMTQSKELLKSLVADLIPGVPVNSREAEVRIQTGRPGEGITDIEIELPHQGIIVIEAKKGATLPSVSQFRQYSTRCKARELGHVLLVALTAIDHDSAMMKLGITEIENVPVTARSWKWARTLIANAQSKESGYRTRWLLSEYGKFLEGFMGNDRVLSNLVYVVSLARGNPKGWEVSWIDVVEKHHRYFYPVGANTWPTPPNYMGFRYNGRLQSIRHVHGYKIVEDIRDHFRGSEAGEEWGTHYLLELGPPIEPPHVVKTGDRVHRSARVWCMLDTLLTCDTISAALTETEMRREGAPD